jgi:hypothetical protein
VKVQCIIICNETLATSDMHAVCMPCWFGLKSFLGTQELWSLNYYNNCIYIEQVARSWVFSLSLTHTHTQRNLLAIHHSANRAPWVLMINKMRSDWVKIPFPFVTPILLLSRTCFRGKNGDQQRFCLPGSFLDCTYREICLESCCLSPFSLIYE